MPPPLPPCKCSRAWAQWEEREVTSPAFVQMEQNSDNLMRLCLIDLPARVVESLLELIPLKDTLPIRKVCRALRDATDAVCKKRRFKAVDPTKYRPQPIDNSDLGAIPPDWGAAGMCSAMPSTWLHHLACVGSPGAVQCALDMGEDVDGQCDASSPALFTGNELGRLHWHGTTPLMLAAGLGHTEVVKVLLKVRQHCGW